MFLFDGDVLRGALSARLKALPRPRGPHFLAVDPVLVQQIMERGAADAQLDRRAADVALHADERLRHDLPLQPIAGLAKRNALAGRSRRDSEVGRLDEAAAREDRRPLNRVFELPDVAGPGVPGDGRQRVAAELQASAIPMAVPT